MSGVWFLKWPLIIFLLGFLVRFAGLLFKIRHWPMADELVMIGTIICAIAIVFAIIKVAFVKKPNQ